MHIRPRLHTALFASIRSAVVLAAFGLAGCAGVLKERTASRIGCPEAEVVIVNDSSGFTSHNWTAECRGRRFLCSENQVAPGRSGDTVCSAELPPVAPVSASAPPGSH